MGVPESPLPWDASPPAEAAGGGGERTPLCRECRAGVGGHIGPSTIGTGFAQYPPQLTVRVPASQPLHPRFMHSRSGPLCPPQSLGTHAASTPFTLAPGWQQPQGPLSGERPQCAAVVPRSQALRNRY